MEVRDRIGLVDGLVEHRRWLHRVWRLGPFQRNRPSDLDKAKQRYLAFHLVNQLVLPRELTHLGPDNHLGLDHVGYMTLVVNTSALVPQTCSIPTST
jgi:hypothetical protein